MSLVRHLDELHDLPAFGFPDLHDRPVPLPAPDAVAWRLRATDSYGRGRDESFAEMWDRFLGTVDPGGVRALIFSEWGAPYEVDSGVVVAGLVAAREQLTGLRAVFIGDLVSEQAEISWIQHSDVSPVLTAYPELRELGVRGGTRLRFSAVRHAGLRRLRIEAGGLPGEAVRGIAASELPALEDLELWLGIGEYGGDTTVADLAPILAGGRLPALRHLGLRNSEIQDEIAAAVASAPVVAQLTSLDLSLGTLGDEGATALLAGPPLTHLTRLDLRHHYLGEETAGRLRAALEPAGVEVDLSDPQAPWNKEEEEEYIYDVDLDGEIVRYTAVGE